jgi:hypothetical protein
VPEESAQSFQIDDYLSLRVAAEEIGHNDPPPALFHPFKQFGPIGHESQDQGTMHPSHKFKSRPKPEEGLCIVEQNVNSQSPPLLASLLPR